MHYKGYFFQFLEDYSYEKKDVFSKIIKPMREVKALAHVTGGTLLLLPASCFQTFILFEIEQAIKKEGTLGIYWLKPLPLTMEYVFWVDIEGHGDILHRSTKANLQEAIQELCTQLSDDHRYKDYVLTKIDMHYQTEKGYLNAREQIRLRETLYVRDLIEQHHVELLAYL